MHKSILFYRQIWELMKTGIEKGHLGVIMYITSKNTSCLDIQILCPSLRCRRHRDGFVDGVNKSHGCRLFLLTSFRNYQKGYEDFPGDPMVKNWPANAENMSSIPGPGRSCMSQSN